MGHETSMIGAVARWEYRTEKLKLRGILGGKINQGELDEMLKEAGEEGWELVSMVSTNLYQGRTQDTALVFKRPKACS